MWQSSSRIRRKNCENEEFHKEKAGGFCAAGAGTEFWVLRDDSVDRLRRQQWLRAGAGAHVGSGSVRAVQQADGGSLHPGNGMENPCTEPSLFGDRLSSSAGAVRCCVWPGVEHRDYNNGNIPCSLLCFFVMVMAFTFAADAPCVKARSFWPAVVLHASHNVFVQSIFDPITGDRQIHQVCDL